MDVPEAMGAMLACPRCESSLVFDDWPQGIRCERCDRVFVVCDGIPVFLERDHGAQLDERRTRDAFASGFQNADRDALLAVVAQHHALPLMLARARRFAARFRGGEWMLDLGIGWGWHWANAERAVGLVGIDMSLQSLMLARRLLGDAPNVVLACADATGLPLQRHSIAGCWSVQVLQHMPDDVLQRTRRELDRVFTDDWQLETSDLNPAPGLAAVYRLAGRRLHRRGRAGAMEVHRRDAREWTEVWRDFRGGPPRLDIGYSELFFHPDLHCRPRRYPLALENVLSSRAPRLAGLIARQIDVRAGTGPDH
jgi:uncharacterized protein YbaR (Trm112 family)